MQTELSEHEAHLRWDVRRLPQRMEGRLHKGKKLFKRVQVKLTLTLNLTLTLTLTLSSSSRAGRVAREAPE